MLRLVEQMAPARRHVVRVLLSATLVMGLLWGSGWAEPLAFPTTAQPVAVPETLEGHQGELLPVTVTLFSADQVPSGILAGHHVPFFPLPGVGRFGALIGLDMNAQPGRRLLTVTVDGETVVELPVIVKNGHFTVQTLTLPDSMVDLDEQTLQRVRQERTEVLATMAPVSAERWWDGPFLMPTDGPTSGSFGRRRIINGEARSPHSGEDISAPEGSKVIASNSGIVRLVADHFFSGKSIFLDHGGGLYTMYFHLSSTVVENGQHVDKGELIGRVGSSGRATGPHLHWGARLNGSRVDPLGLTRLRFP